MTEEIHIRKVAPKDLAALVDLCHAHAEYEKAAYTKEGKVEMLAKHLCTSEPSCICLVLSYKGSLIAYASLIKQFSTWDANFYLYLDCLFIQEEFRGLGLGQKMMEAVKQEAFEQGCTSIQWQTPDFNHLAIKFYENVGALRKRKERFFWDLV